MAGITVSRARDYFAFFVAAFLGFGASSASADVILSYDSLGRLTSAQYDDQKTQRYDYDPAGNRAQVSVINGSVPNAADDAVNVSHSSGVLDFDPLSNDQSTSGGTLSLVGAQTTGSLVAVKIIEGALLRLTPVDGSGTGQQTITYTITDENGGAASAIVTVTLQN